MKYSFKKNIFPSEISYVNHYSIFAYFSNKTQTNEFFLYLFYRIENDYKLREKGIGGYAHLLRNDNDRMAVVDVNYNFLIEVLGEWIQHYSNNKEIIYEYVKYRRNTKEVGIDASELFTRNMKINLTVKEKVLFDYSFCGWMIMNKFHKRLRFNLFQVFFNNMIGKWTYIPNYKYYTNARVINNILLRDLKSKDYYKLGFLSFNRSALSNILGKKRMENIHKMAEEYEIIISTSIAIKKRIEKLGIEKDVKSYLPIDVKKIEDMRDMGDGKWTLFKAEVENEGEHEEVENN